VESVTHAAAARQRRRAALTLMLGIVCTALDAAVMSLALPGIARDLGVSAADSVWVVNAFQLVALGMLLPCAALGDRWGYRRVYMAGAAVFALACAVCIVAPSLPVLAAARGLQGLGAASMMAINGALLRLIYPRELLARGLAINTAVVAFTSVCGPPVAAAVLSWTSWHGLFVPGLVLGPAVALLGATALPANAPRAAPAPALPVADVLLNMAMFSLFFVGVHLAGERPMHGADPNALPGASAWLAVLLVAAGVAVGVFHVRRQLRRPEPLFPVDLLRLPVFRLSMCTSVCAFGAQTLAYIALPFLLFEGWQRTPGEAGLLMAIWPLALICTLPLVTRLIGRYPSSILGALGLGCLALGLVVLALLPSAPTLTAIAVGMALCGLGYGVFQSPNNHTILTAAPAQRAGAAGGMLSSARLTGQSVGAVLMVAVFNLAGAQQGSVHGLWLGAVLAALAAGFSLMRLSSKS
jgi:DHA2 family multidrug resistance protein-like MFS transporter